MLRVVLRKIPAVSSIVNSCSTHLVFSGPEESRILLFSQNLISFHLNKRKGRQREQQISSSTFIWLQWLSQSAQIKDSRTNLCARSSDEPTPMVIHRLKQFRSNTWAK
jgi:hypothetical protein